MKNTILFAFLLLSFTGRAQDAQTAEPVYSITKVQKDFTYYNQQANLWTDAIKNAPKDGKAWIYYYNAARMNNMFAGENDQRFDIDALVEDLKKNLPNTFEYNYITFARMGRTKEGYQYLDKAYAMDPDRFNTWEAFISKAIMENDMATVKKMNAKWIKHPMYSPGITSWNYNALIGLAPNSVLVTFGDNDTYPLWLLQELKGIRKDVQVLNASLVLDETYQKMIFKKLNIPLFEERYESFGNDYTSFRNAMLDHIIKHISRPTYFGVSAPKSFRDKYNDQLHLVGLTYEYCNEDFDHIAVIRKNFEKNFLKDYLKTNLNRDFSQSVVDHMNQQYLPCLTVLYKHYHLSGEVEKAEEVKSILVDIAQKNNREKVVEDFLAKFEE